jgi:hypothetical protein
MEARSEKRCELVYSLKPSRLGHFSIRQVPLVSNIPASVSMPEVEPCLRIEAWGGVALLLSGVEDAPARVVP